MKLYAKLNEFTKLDTGYLTVEFAQLLPFWQPVFTVIQKVCNTYFVEFNEVWQLVFNTIITQIIRTL